MTSLRADIRICTQKCGLQNLSWSEQELEGSMSYQVHRSQRHISTLSGRSGNSQMRSRLDKKTKIEELQSATPCNTTPELRLQTAQVAWKASEILCPRTSSLQSRPHRHCTPPATWVSFHHAQPVSSLQNTEGSSRKQWAMKWMLTGSS